MEANTRCFPITLVMCKEWEEGDKEDRRERQELECMGVLVKLDECNSQRLLEKPALDEEDAHTLDIMETERYLELHRTTDK